MIEVQQRVINRTLEDWLNDIRSFGPEKATERYVKNIREKDIIYLSAIAMFEKDIESLCSKEGSSRFLADVYMSHKIFEAQYFHESVKMPVVEKSTFKTVSDNFPNNPHETKI